MALVLVATPGGSTSNAYCDSDWANAYFESRADLSSPWEDLDPVDKDRFLVMATRILDQSFRGQKILVTTGSKPIADSYYVTKRKWVGTPSTATQRLAHPRIGLLDQNGNVINSAIVHGDLKDATAELAGQLQIADRTLDSDVSVQGIKSVSAGPVSVSFRDGPILAQVLPDSVVNMMPPQWFVDEQMEGVVSFAFEVL